MRGGFAEGLDSYHFELNWAELNEPILVDLHCRVHCSVQPILVDYTVEYTVEYDPSSWTYTVK